MSSFRCYDNSDDIATLIVTNFHLYPSNTTVVTIFPNVCLRGNVVYAQTWQVLTLKNCIEPLSYASTAYVVASYGPRFFDCFVKIWATCKNFLGNWFTASPGKKLPVHLCMLTPADFDNC